LSFLEGDITTRFILKALAVLVVIGSAFAYYLLDAGGYWIKRERLSLAYGGAVVVLIVAGLVASLGFIDSPSEVRATRIDQNQITDLQNIQWRIQDYIALNNRVPEALADVSDGSTLPTAPSERTAYRYEKTESGFQLCATFSRDSLPQDNSFSMPFDKTALIRNPDNWSYTAGESCFERTVNLEATTE
jgi:type II secretory pathway pseudopilin PulG